VKLTARYSRAARKQLEALSSQDRERVLTAVDRLTLTEQGDIKQLKGPLQGLFRLRVGKLRAIFSITPPSINIVEIENRGEAY